MRRLNDSELNARIDQFLYRKFSEFPELGGEGGPPKRYMAAQTRTRVTKELN